VRAYQPAGDIRITGTGDESRITDLCERHRDTIEQAMSLSVTVSALCLRVLNWFDLDSVKCPEIEVWNLDGVPARHDIQTAAPAPRKNFRTAGPQTTKNSDGK